MAFLEDEFKQMVNNEFSHVANIDYLTELANNVASNIRDINSRSEHVMSDSDRIKFMALFGAMLNVKLTQTPEDDNYWRSSSIGC